MLQVFVVVVVSRLGLAIARRALSRLNPLSPVLRRELDRLRTGRRPAMKSDSIQSRPRPLISSQMSAQELKKFLRRAQPEKLPTLFWRSTAARSPLSRDSRPNMPSIPKKRALQLPLFLPLGGPWVSRTAGKWAR